MRSLLLAMLVLGAVMPIAHAEKITMKDGQQVEGRLLQMDGERVVIGVSRSDVTAVDGKPLPPPVTAGAKAPDFTVQDINGASHTMSKNDGRVTLLQFWASWCPHCRSDVSKLKELNAKDQAKLRVLTVSMDQKPEALAALMGKEQVTYPVILGMQYPDLADAYEAQGIPAYFLIDPKGTIVKTWSGSVTEGGNKDFENEINALMLPAR